MISKDSMALLHNAIAEYNKLADKDYLLACNLNKNHPIEYIVIRINKHNFWHLLGCKILKKDKNNKTITLDLYNECFLKNDISEYLEYTHTSQELKTKYLIFIKIFNFVNNAKSVKVCKTDNSPEYYQFKIAVGHYSGIIGYDYENKSLSILFPKTTQDKSIDSFDNNKSAKRIIYILSKAISDSSFDIIEYAPSEAVFKKVINELPCNYSSNIRDSYNDTNES